MTTTRWLYAATVGLLAGVALMGWALHGSGFVRERSAPRGSPEGWRVDPAHPRVTLGAATARAVGLDLTQTRLSVYRLDEVPMGTGSVVSYAASLMGRTCGLLYVDADGRLGRRVDLSDCTSFTAPPLVRDDDGRVFTAWERGGTTVVLAEVTPDGLGVTLSTARPETDEWLLDPQVGLSLEDGELVARYAPDRVLVASRELEPWPRGPLHAARTRLGDRQLLAAALGLGLAALLWLLALRRETLRRAIRRGRLGHDLWTHESPSVDLTRARHVEMAGCAPADPWTALGDERRVAGDGAYRERRDVRARVVLPGHPEAAEALALRRRNRTWAVAAAATALALAWPALQVFLTS